MKKIKVLSTAAIAGLGIAALASCGGGSSSGKTITFYNTCGQNLQTKITEAIDAFEAKYGWKVESTQIGGYDDVYSTCIAGLTANAQPNIAYAYSDHVAAYIQSGKVLDLAKFIDSNEEIQGTKLGYTAEEKADFVKGYYNEGLATNYANYDKYGFTETSMLTMPFSKSTELMYVNTDALKGAGIVNADGSAKIPQTWDELWAACDTLKAKYPQCTPFCYDSESNWVINMAMQNGWKYTSASEPYFVFKNDANLASWMDSLTAKYEAGIISTQTTYGAYTSGLFTTGVEEGGCVFCVGSSGGASYQDPGKKFGWSVEEVPGTLKDGKINKSVISQGPSLCLFDSGNDEVNKMTWLFVKSILEPEFQSTFSQTSGYNPVRNSTYEIADYKAFLEKGTIIAEAAKTAKGLTDWYYTSPAFKGSADARQYIGSALVSVIKGEATGVDALTTAYKNCGGK